MAFFSFYKYRKRAANGNSSERAAFKLNGNMAIEWISKTCTTLSNRRQKKRRNIDKRQTDKHYANDMIVVYVILS